MIVYWCKGSALILRTIGHVTAVNGFAFHFDPENRKHKSNRSKIADGEMMSTYIINIVWCLASLIFFNQILYDLSRVIKFVECVGKHGLLAILLKESISLPKFIILVTSSSEQLS